MKNLWSYVLVILIVQFLWTITYLEFCVDHSIGTRVAWPVYASSLLDSVPLPIHSVRHHFDKSICGNIFCKRKLNSMTATCTSEAILMYLEFGDKEWIWAETAPALWPNNVTSSGFPPKKLILSWTHSRTRRYTPDAIQLTQMCFLQVRTHSLDPWVLRCHKCQPLVNTKILRHSDDSWMSQQWHSLGPDVRANSFNETRYVKSEIEKKNGHSLVTISTAEFKGAAMNPNHNW